MVFTWGFWGFIYSFIMELEKKMKGGQNE